MHQLHSVPHITVVLHATIQLVVATWIYHVQIAVVPRRLPDKRLVNLNSQDAAGPLASTSSSSAVPAAVPPPAETIASSVEVDETVPDMQAHHRMPRVLFKF